MIVWHNKKKNNNGVTLVNYSNEKYTHAQKINTKTALKIGRFKKVISYSPSDIDVDFWNKNKLIFEQARGGGYWLWKSYFIKKTLSEMNEGERLFYCDSGSLFINSIDQLLNCFESTVDIMPFELQNIEKYWTKRDCFQLMCCDEPKILESKQIQATFCLWRKSNFSMRFVEEWLHYAQDERILTDIENQLGFSNYLGFVEHRHDQSIFSLLIKKYKIKAYRDPSQFGSNLIGLYPDSKYPQILISTRQMNITYFEFMKKKLRKDLLPKSHDYYSKFVKRISEFKIVFEIEKILVYKKMGLIPLYKDSKPIPARKKKKMERRPLFLLFFLKKIFAILKRNILLLRWVRGELNRT
jgi:hypothetical protein